MGIPSPRNTRNGRLDAKGKAARDRIVTHQQSALDSDNPSMPLSERHRVRRLLPAWGPRGELEETSFNLQGS
jgi:hypothetical protein